MTKQSIIQLNQYLRCIRAAKKYLEDINLTVYEKEFSWSNRTE